MGIEKRYTRRQVCELLSCGESWLDNLIARGVVGYGHRDPGGRRIYWWESQIEDAQRKLRASAVPATPDTWPPHHLKRRAG